MQNRRQSAGYVGSTLVYVSLSRPSCVLASPGCGSARTLRWQPSMGACARNSVVPGDADQVGQKPVACVARGGLELIQSVLGAWARRELAAAHCKRAKREHALVIVGQRPHQLSQKVEGLRMRLQALGRRRRGDALSTEHLGVDE